MPQTLNFVTKSAGEDEEESVSSVAETVKLSPIDRPLFFAVFSVRSASSAAEGRLPFSKYGASIPASFSVVTAASLRSVSVLLSELFMSAETLRIPAAAATSLS